MQGGRKKASSAVLIITDGRPSFRFETQQAVNALRDKGVKVVITPVKEFPSPKDNKSMKKWSSAPWQSNLINIPGLKKLAMDFNSYVTKTIVQFCPKAESPKYLKKLKKLLGFKLIKKRAKCRKVKKKKYVGKFPTPGGCADKVRALGGKYKYFRYGKKGWKKGRCYAEVLKGKNCKIGKKNFFRSDRSYNTYKMSGFLF